MNRTTFATAVGGIGAVAFLAFGLWPFIDPQSFYDELAPWPPYNEHFLHDIGAFQIGIGVALALALWQRSNALFAALGGAGAGAAFHAAAHFIDHGDGGKDTDVYVFGVMAALLLAGAWVSFRKA